MGVCVLRMLDHKGGRNAVLHTHRLFTDGPAGKKGGGADGLADGQMSRWARMRMSALSGGVRESMSVGTIEQRP
eukprot:5285850-Alexandrium_andersonii.AAC.1